MLVSIPTYCNLTWTPGPDPDPYPLGTYDYQQILHFLCCFAIREKDEVALRLWSLRYAMPGLQPNRAAGLAARGESRHLGGWGWADWA